LAELEEARLLALCLDQPAAAVAASMGKAKVSGNIVQRHEHGKPGDFNHLNDEELKESLYDVTKELAELDPEFAEFTKQLAQQKRRPSTRPMVDISDICANAPGCSVALPAAVPLETEVPPSFATRSISFSRLEIGKWCFVPWSQELSLQAGDQLRW
jgi:hypothetical protein